MSVAAHQSPYAGTWYPGDPSQLDELVTELFDKSERRTGADFLENPAGFVVPHAGLSYSGAVAASVYRRLASSPPGLVILLGFAHRGHSPGVWTPDVTAYSCPLGVIEVDPETVNRLVESGAARSGREAALCDHSVEIQLPLLRKAAPQCRVVPLYVSGLEPEQRRRTAKSLAELMSAGAVVLASSDFTHYGDSFGYKPFPHDDRTPMRLRELDDGFIDVAGSIDGDFLLRTLRSESATVCGREPIALLLEAIRALPGGDDYFQCTLDYETSGDITGDFSHTVSYAALGYYPWKSFQVSQEDARLLLDSARETLSRLQETGLAQPIESVVDAPALRRKAGAFVTLHQNGRLRGCVGRITATEPLRQLIPAMTLAAALEDSRFAPLGPDETGIELDISILSPMKRLLAPSRFRVGLDGGYLKVGGLSGLLLPQVAEGRDWTASEFLSALARKAHLADSVYDAPDTRLYVFRAQVLQ